jgi:hypothetical protein
MACIEVLSFLPVKGTDKNTRMEHPDDPVPTLKKYTVPRPHFSACKYNPQDTLTLGAKRNI